MTNSLRDFLSAKRRKKFATEQGAAVHAKMQHIVLDGNIEHGDKELINKIKSHSELMPFFNKNARTEVPIAGIINGKFISRRIDRLIVQNTGQIVTFLDYKTDTNKDAFRDKYIRQMQEYAALLRDVYPGYTVRGIILWLHDFTTEDVK